MKTQLWTIDYEMWRRMIIPRYLNAACQHFLETLLKSFLVIRVASNPWTQILLVVVDCYNRSFNLKLKKKIAIENMHPPHWSRSQGLLTRVPHQKQASSRPSPFSPVLDDDPPLSTSSRQASARCHQMEGLHHQSRFALQVQVPKYPIHLPHQLRIH